MREVLNRTVYAREYLEAREPGSFARVIETALAAGGVVHCAPDCFLAGVPCSDDAGCLHVVFQTSHLPALRMVLAGLPYERVEWRRDWGHSAAYGTRKRAVADFFRHRDFGTGLMK